MKRNFAIAVAAAALLLGSAVPLWAQWNALAGAAWQDFANGLPNGQRFQNFVQTHPGVGRELQSNPNLLWDPAWRRNHPAVGQWIYHHQPLWHNMVARQAGMYPSTFGNFASNRPGLMNDLNENPGLAEDQGYLRQHPDFADFMRNHPGFQQDMRDRAQYWRNHHSYQGWRWHHAWNDAGAQPWTPPGLMHSNGHAYGWYKHHGPGGWNGGPGPHGGHGWGHGPDQGWGQGHDGGWDHGH